MFFFCYASLSLIFTTINNINNYVCFFLSPICVSHLYFFCSYTFIVYFVSLFVQFAHKIFVFKSIDWKEEKKCNEKKRTWAILVFRKSVKFYWTKCSVKYQFNLFIGLVKYANFQPETDKNRGGEKERVRQILEEKEKFKYMRWKIHFDLAFIMQLFVMFLLPNFMQTENATTQMIYPMSFDFILCA